MSNPKFAVGEKVAVLAIRTGMPTICYPETIVDEMVFTGKPPRYVYGVKHDSEWYFDAEYLRPLKPGDYDDITQDIHKPVEVDA